MQQIAEFSTTCGAQLLATLSKHFAHKIRVDMKDDHAQFHFDIGEARIDTTAEGLLLTARADGEGDMDRLRQVLESHLLRFAYREDPQPLRWTVPAA